MPAQLKRQVVASFALRAAAIQLAIQGDPGLYADSNVHLLLTPNVDATVRANVGTVRLEGSKTLEVAGGVLQFSGSDTASLPGVPAEAAPEFETLFAFDAEGNEVSARAWYDAPAFTVRATRKFTGAVSYAPFTTTARILTYTPEIEPSPSGPRVTYGVIAAYYQGALVIHPVEAFTLVNGVAMPEFYRIYSQKVITPDGEFEKPPTYPAAGSYPDKSLVIDVTTSILVERAHEVGYIDELGRVFINTPNVLILEPYVGDGNYTPVKSVRVATLDPETYPKDIIAKANDFVRSKGLGRA